MRLRRSLALAALACLPLAGQAKVYFVNQGVNYHIGDNRYATSEDRDFVGAYPVVGQEWVQALTVSEDDRVKIHVNQVWGVDDCRYCKIILSIDGVDMGRLYHEDNHKPFDTPSPLAFKVEAGKTHILKIASYGLGTEGADDFLLEGVSVETVVAEVRFLAPGPLLLAPGARLPQFTLPAPRPVAPQACPGLKLVQGGPAFSGSGAQTLSLTAAANETLATPMLVLLEPGQAFEFFVRVDAAEAEADQVSRALEIVAGQAPLLVAGASPGAAADPATGWALTLDNARRVIHGNLIKEGLYRAKGFRLGGAPLTSWTRATVAYCPEGALRLQLAGREASLKIPYRGPAPVAVRGVGVSVSLAQASLFDKTR